MDRHSHLLLEQFAEIIFGKTDLITDRVDREIFLIILGNIFQRGIHGCLLRRSQLLDLGNIVGNIVERGENGLQLLVDV